MRPLICPQCGGQITDYEPGAAFAVCDYCSTRFLIEENKQPRELVSEPLVSEASEPGAAFVRILGISVGIVAFIVVMAVALSKSSSSSSGRSPSSSAGIARTPTATRTPVPSPTPDLALSRFIVQDPSRGETARSEAIGVDAQGAVYVGDDKLRVQQFDANGNFVRMLQVPEKGRNYERARVIHKLAVDREGRLYVAVGGVILVYGKDWKTPQRVVHAAPDYTQDFALKPDGSMVAVSTDGQIETLLFVNRSGGISKRIRGFHTDALRSSMSPLGTASESVRVAVGSDGSIYSIYALGTLGSYSLGIGGGDLRIAKFSPEGKYLKAFGQSSDSCGISVDSEGRVLVSDKNGMSAWTADGVVAGVPGSAASLNSFAVGPGGEVFTLDETAVAKWPVG